jgi:hypothetical protein
MHALHVWEVTSGFPALSAHVLVRPSDGCHAIRAALEGCSNQVRTSPTRALQVDHERRAQLLSTKRRARLGRRTGAIRQGGVEPLPGDRAILARMSVQALRGRMPLLAFLLLAVLCLALFGFACACLSDYPMQALERALGAIPALPALVEVWSVLALLALGLAALIVTATRARARAPSPAALQRFLL